MSKNPQSTPAERAPKAKRRAFLKLAGIGTVGGAAAALGDGAAVAEVAPGPEAAGYRETAHVKKVYQLARF